MQTMPEIIMKLDQLDALHEAARQDAEKKVNKGIAYRNSLTEQMGVIQADILRETGHSAGWTPSGFRLIPGMDTMDRIKRYLNISLLQANSPKEAVNHQLLFSLKRIAKRHTFASEFLAEIKRQEIGGENEEEVKEMKEVLANIIADIEEGKDIPE